MKEKTTTKVLITHNQHIAHPYGQPHAKFGSSALTPREQNGPRQVAPLSVPQFEQIRVPAFWITWPSLISISCSTAHGKQTQFLAFWLTWSSLSSMSRSPAHGKARSKTHNQHLAHPYGQPNAKFGCSGLHAD